jgi:hypothetical protein
VVEEPPPKGPGFLLEPPFISVDQQKEAAAFGTGIEEFGDAEFLAALQAAVGHVAAGGRDENGSYFFRELFGFHNASFESVLQR